METAGWVVWMVLEPHSSEDSRRMAYCGYTTRTLTVVVGELSTEYGIKANHHSFQ